MEINTFTLFRSCNIGIFLKCNEKFVLVPKNIAVTKAEKLSTFLGVPYIRASVSGLRLLGPLIAMNSNGILVSKYIEDDELKSLKSETGLPVERFPSNYTAVGNLISVNDKGAIVSNIFSSTHVKVIQDVLDVPTERMNVAGYTTVGSLIFATNVGALVHPLTSDREVEKIKSILKTEVTHCTVNDGVPFVSSGILGNSKGIVVGNLTNGTELMTLSMIFR
ncbi:MAG: translation initiation factor IF-6 [Nitrososphaeria archaeon]